MPQTILGIIGGSGLYQLEGLTNQEEFEIETPFGKPSSPITIGTIGNTKLAFLARHGRGHTLLPSEINFRANIYALKLVGAEWCLGVGAVGSLKEEIKPGDMVVPDQFIDRTRDRESTFFGKGIVAHVAFAKPFCPVLREKLLIASRIACKKAGVGCHDGGTYICMEGPAFSTRAESELYRSWGGSVIGMTNLTEAKLAREAEIAYATLAMATDYDCWRSEEEEVNVAEILRVLQANSELSKGIIAALAPLLAGIEPSAIAKNALATAIITDKTAISNDVKARLQPIIGKYLA